MAFAHICHYPPARPAVIASGNQIALNCNKQILVGNVDGSDISALTPDGLDFGPPVWSPDGRWLLSGWQRDFETSSICLLPAHGSQAQCLSAEPSLLWPVGWSHTGRRVYYYQAGLGGGRAGGADPEKRGYWIVDVETGQSRRLPLWWARFSPDGRRVVYFERSQWDAGDPLWLAEVNDQVAWGQELENVRQLVRGAGTDVTDVTWSPDSARLALILYGSRAEPGEGVVAIYDLAHERLAFAHYDLNVHLYQGYLLDPDSGPLYSTDQVRWFAWSPDGEWLAFEGTQQLVTVDRDG